MTAVVANLKANPKTFTIFTVDAVTSEVLREFVKNDVDHRFFLAGGYASEELIANLNKMVQLAAVAEFTPTRLLEVGLDGGLVVEVGDVPRLVEFRINVTESLGTPAMWKSQALQWKTRQDARR